MKWIARFKAWNLRRMKNVSIPTADKLAKMNEELNNSAFQPDSSIEWFKLPAWFRRRRSKPEN